MVKKIKKYCKLSTIVSLLISVALLSGCAGMNGKFDCNATAGDSCTPVSIVNRNAQAGDYDNVDNSGDSGSASQQNFGYASKDVGYNVTTPIPGEPVRFGESVQRIWIAPYKDSSHNFHEPSYVYTVLNKSHWIGLPQPSITDDSNGD
jgi:type IV conjugative transfer system lipoprotein TraV